MGPRRVRTLLAALILAALALPPSTAGAYVYWSSFDGRGGGGTIGRANLDGTGANPSFITVPNPGPGELAVAGRHFYWGDYLLHRAIGRSGLHGEDPNSVFFEGSADSLAVDSRYIYTRNACCMARIPLAGGVDDKWGFSAGRPVTGIAVDTRFVYFSMPNKYGETGAIGRGALEGGGADMGFIKTAGDPRGLEVDARHIYWTNVEAGAIGRADIDGRNVDPRFIELADGSVFDVTVGDDFIFWTSACCIGRADLDGTHVIRKLLPSPEYFWGIAVDRAPDTRIVTAKQRFNSAADPDEWRVKFTFKSSQPDSKFSCSFDGGRYRLCTSPAGYRVFTAGKHSFRVKAMSPQSRTDRSPARRSFSLSPP